MENLSKKAVLQNVYEFIRMENPNGQFMCFSSVRRANWYMDRQLAEWVDDHTFRLKFNPRGNGKADVPYYNEKVENVCVVCGCTENMTRHHVFPYMFKSQVPLHYKARSNYDILPLCSDCHEDYEKEADVVKKELREQFFKSEAIQVDEKEIKRIKSVLASRRFIDQYNKNPAIYKSVPLRKVNADRVKAQENIDVNLLNMLNKNSNMWVKKLMNNLCSNEDDLYGFVKFWRNHFVTIMKPKHLPKLWSVNMPLEVTNEYKQEQDMKKRYNLEKQQA